MATIEPDIKELTEKVLFNGIEIEFDKNDTVWIPGTDYLTRVDMAEKEDGTDYLTRGEE